MVKVGNSFKILGVCWGTRSFLDTLPCTRMKLDSWSTRSLSRANLLICSSFAKHNLASNASYSTSLFEAGKLIGRARSNKVLSGVIMIMLGPAHLWYDVSSTLNCHMPLGRSTFARGVSFALKFSLFFVTSFSSSVVGVNSTTKSTKALVL